MIIKSIPAEGDLSMLEEKDEEGPYCPICGTDLSDDYTDCGCYADIHYGHDR